MGVVFTQPPPQRALEAKAGPQLGWAVVPSRLQRPTPPRVPLQRTWPQSDRAERF